MKLKIKDLAKNNSSFQLKCLLALTGTAIVAAGAIAALSIKSAAVAAPAATLLSSAAAISPIVPIALPIVLLSLGGVCLLPFLFSNACRFTGRRSYDTYSTPYYRSSIFSTPEVNVRHYHRHADPIASTHHGHSYATNAHGHSGSMRSNYPGHGVFSSVNHHGHAGGSAVPNTHGHGYSAPN